MTRTGNAPALLLLLSLVSFFPASAGPGEEPARAAAGAPEEWFAAAELEAGAEAPEVGPEAEIERAVRVYRETGEAAVLKRSDSIVYPFDESQPVVKCSPLRACDIELQAGEVVTGVAVGDAERWVTSPLLSGDPDRPTPHVVVKPKEYDLATNLVVGTTRRTYHLGLISPAKNRVTSGELAYYRHVAFYYPNELVREWATAEALARVGEERREEATLVELSALSVDQLNFRYRVEPGKKATFAPKTVFDDGRHVYLELPPGVASADLPALLVQAPDGTMAVSNYRLAGRWYVVDGLFRRAELVVGAGKAKRKVRIENLAPVGGSR